MTTPDDIKSGSVLAVSVSSTHTMTKPNQASIRVIEGLGVEGDAHQGETVKHRSRVARNPNQPNLRQVHLIHGELLDELREQGFDLEPGQMGENVTTHGIDLLGLPLGTRLFLGADAMVTPCPLCHLNLDGFQPKASAQVGRKIGLPILHMPQAIGLAMGISPKDLGLQRHIMSTKPLIAKLSAAD